MNWIKLKRNWNVAKLFFKIGTAFWAVETIYFLIAYGWHIQSINQQERICDFIALLFLTVCFVLTGQIIVAVIEFLLSDIDDSHPTK